MVEALIALEVGAKNRVELQKIDLTDQEGLEALVQICRVDKIKDREATRLTLAMTEGPAKRALKAAIMQVGGEYRGAHSPWATWRTS